MLAGLNRSGLGKKAFISVPESIYQKDPYKDQLSVELQYQNSMHKKSPMHEQDFKPGSGYKTMYFSPNEAPTHRTRTLKRSNQRRKGR